MSSQGSRKRLAQSRQGHLRISIKASFAVNGYVLKPSEPTSSLWSNTCPRSAPRLLVLHELSVHNYNLAVCKGSHPVGTIIASEYPAILRIVPDRFSIMLRLSLGRQRECGRILADVSRRKPGPFGENVRFNHIQRLMQNDGSAQIRQQELPISIEPELFTEI